MSNPNLIKHRTWFYSKFRPRLWHQSRIRCSSKFWTLRWSKSDPVFIKILNPALIKIRIRFWSKAWPQRWPQIGSDSHPNSDLGFDQKADPILSKISSPALIKHRIRFWSEFWRNVDPTQEPMLIKIPTPTLTPNRVIFWSTFRTQLRPQTGAEIWHHLWSETGSGFDQNLDPSIDHQSGRNGARVDPPPAVKSKLWFPMFLRFQKQCAPWLVDLPTPTLI